MERPIIKELVHHDLLYHLGVPEISDTEYDKLRSKAKELYPDDPYFQTVGAKTKREKVQLPFVLGSLNKVKSHNVVEWMRKKSNGFVVSEKIDGVSIYVVYVDGKVEWAATRGDGYYGQDITEKAKIFCEDIRVKEGVFCLRGEATLKIDPSVLGYKTKRNGCAGILNRDDYKYCEHITSYYYEVLESPDDVDMKTELGRMSILEKIGVKMPRFYTIPVTENVTDEWLMSKLSEMYTNSRHTKDYNVDGLVIAVNLSQREDVLLPENKVAFKLNEEAVEVTVTDIEWNTTRTGRIVPVILVEPTTIQGVTVSRVTGHNFEYVSVNGIRSGAKIGIVRSGDVIPYIVEVYWVPESEFTPISGCPSCGSDPMLKGVDIVCGNKLCPAQSNLILEYWLRTLGAEGITHKTLEKIGINSIPELYNLDEFDLMAIPGIGPKKSEKILYEIQKTLHTTPAKLLQAMGIPGVAESTSKALIDYFGSINLVLSVSQSSLEEVEGVGPIIAGNIVRNQKRCHELLQSININLDFNTREQEKPVKESHISGMLFCITGKLPMKRDLLVTIIESHGGRWKNSVTKDTDFLITDNPGSGSRKVQNANKYGTRVISYKEFMEMIGEEI